MLRALRFSVLLILLAALFAPAQTWAKSVRDFEAMTVGDQSQYVVAFLEKMTNDLRQVNPALAQDIKDYFVKKEPGKPTSAGMEKLAVELTALDIKAREGKADLSKIELESVIVWVVKQKFPPPKKS